MVAAASSTPIGSSACRPSRVSEDTDANGNQTAAFEPFVATGTGNARFTQAPSVALSRSRFDRFDRLLSSTDAFGATTTYTYERKRCQHPLIG